MFVGGLVDQSIKKVDLDFEYGCLCMVQGQSQIRFYRLGSTSAEYLTRLQLNRERSIMSAEFLPFGTGFALTTEKGGEGIEWFQIAERESQTGAARKWSLQQKKIPMATKVSMGT